MKRFLLATAAVFAASGAMAADLSINKAPAPVVAAYTPAYNWSGLYFGLQGGGDIAAIPLSNLNAGSGATAGTVFGDPGVFGAGANGFTAGGHVGFNIPFTSVFIGGIEVGAQATGLQSNQNVTVAAPAPLAAGSVVTADSAFNLLWDAYADAKIGFLLSPRTLWYGIGGVSFGEIKDTASITSVMGTTALTANDVRTGWNLGTGVDYCFDPKFCMGARYRYVSYGSKTLGALTDPSQTVVFAPNRPSAFNEFTVRVFVPSY
jgi:outer membrane immunogenic protein